MTTGKNEITAQRASEYGIAAQRAGEGDSEFRHRVAGALRAQGLIIEAHEAQNNSLYNDQGAGGELAMAGIMGAMALALSGQVFNRDDPCARTPGVTDYELTDCDASGRGAASSGAVRDGVSRVGHEMVAGLYLKNAPTPEEREQEAAGLMMMLNMLESTRRR